MTPIGISRGNRERSGGEQRTREEKANSSGTADGDNDEGLRLAKQRQLSSPRDGPPLKRNREVYSRRLEGPASSRCDNQSESSVIRLKRTTYENSDDEHNIRSLCV